MKVFLVSYRNLSTLLDFPLGVYADEEKAKGAQRIAEHRHKNFVKWAKRIGGDEEFFLAHGREERHNAIQNFFKKYGVPKVHHKALLERDYCSKIAQHAFYTLSVEYYP